MVGDNEVSNLSSDRVLVIPNTLESNSTETVPESVRRSSKIIPQVKRMVKKMKMTSKGRGMGRNDVRKTGTYKHSPTTVTL